MLVRRITFHAPRRSLLKQYQKYPSRPRHMSSSAVGSSLQPGTSYSAISSIIAELDKLGPRFDIRADEIKILENPKDFYETLKEKLRGARKRIFLSTLYVGKSEHELISCIREALQQSQELTVSILTDALRGTRETPEPSCASLLSPLVADFPGRVEIRMYHTPNLTGLRKRFIPKRINEGWGLQHMKMYGIDDEIILSGANLSNDYFTNRQDRYHVFSSKSICNYFWEIHSAMCKVSFVLEPGVPKTSYQLMWPPSNASPSPLLDPSGYIAATGSIFSSFLRPRSASTSLPGPNMAAVYPLLIIPRVVNNELSTLKLLLTTQLPPSSRFLFTAGYFNPHPIVTSSLLSCARTGVGGTVVTASPWANGFFGSKGVSGMLPAAYTLLSRRFLSAAEREAPGAITLREWRLGTVGRPHGWTYHAKGLWLTLGDATGVSARDGSDPVPAEHPPTDGGQSVTVIGSSNYTVRSYSLDTEVGAVVVTGDRDLRQRLKEEQENLLRCSRPVSLEDLSGSSRRVGLGVRVAMWIVTAVGGSL